MDHICWQCQKSFQGRASSKFCSRVCSGTYYKSRLEGQASKGGKARRGVAQDKEHVAKRAASMMATLSATTRHCRHCGDPFTPTSGPQVFCSGRCWNATNRNKRYKQQSGALGRRSWNRLNPKEYEAQLLAQKGVCSVCKGANQNGHKLAQDHCHTSGEFRGLLCHRCNTALGLFRDDPFLLKEAIKYLKKFAKQQGG